ncbi:MAG TPA: hypothetical protein VGW75_06795 [Solirubrobacteraceae bacterium]|jgi:hypothetical protein|nr:hypothetical protein [Solirubrobacteraceae bacterium]
MNRTTTGARTSATDKPTPKQLDYLRRLAASRGQTFRYPHTRAEASAEIKRLKETRPDSRLDRAVEREAARRLPAWSSRDAAAVRDHEIEGYGSSARWARSGEARS